MGLGVTRLRASSGTDRRAKPDVDADRPEARGDAGGSQRCGAANCSTCSGRGAGAGRGFAGSLKGPCGAWGFSHKLSVGAPVVDISAQAPQSVAFAVRMTRLRPKLLRDGSEHI